MSSSMRLIDNSINMDMEEAKCIINSATFDVDAVDYFVSPTEMHSSLCLTRTLFSRLLGWRDGSHVSGTQWT